MKKWLGVIVAVAVLVGITVVSPKVVSFLEGPVHDEAIALVPGDADFYANVFLEAPGDQAEALEALLEKFPKVESAEDARQDLFNLFDEALDEVNLTFEEDIEPWLGHQVAFYMSARDLTEDPRFAAFLAVEDQGDAERAIEQVEESDAARGVDEPESKSYKGIDYDFYEDEDGDEGESFALGFVRRFLVLATERGFKDVVDTSLSADNLAASERYKDSFRGLPEENIASLYVDAKPFFEMLSVSGDIPPSEFALFEDLISDTPNASTVSLSPNSISFESSSEPSPFLAFASFGLASAGTELIGTVPSTSWAAVGVPELGNLISGFIDLFGQIGPPGTDRETLLRGFKRETGLDLDKDILSWMGDAALFVQGTRVAELAGGLVLETSDPATTKETLDKLAVLIAREGGVIPQEENRSGYEGFSIGEGLPQPIYALVKDRLIITFGERATEDLIAADDLLADAAGFESAQAALGTGFTPALFIDADAAISLGEFAAATTGSLPEEYTEDVKPWLDPISFVISGSREEGDRLIQKVVVGIGEESLS